jgi:hypothetical protein
VKTHIFEIVDLKWQHGLQLLASTLLRRPSPRSLGGTAFSSILRAPFAKVVDSITHNYLGLGALQKKGQLLEHAQAIYMSTISHRVKEI